MTTCGVRGPHSPATTAQLVLPFGPRTWQRRLIYAPQKTLGVVAHRRAGKSVGLMYRGLRIASAIEREDPPGFVRFMAPYLNQAKRLLWGYLTRTVGAWPGVNLWKSDLLVQLPNGCFYQLHGADNAEACRGLYADHFQCDEFGDFPPDVLDVQPPHLD